MAFWFATEYDPVVNGSIDGTDVTPHDRGLIRALKSTYDPNKDPKVQGNPRTTLFVGRLSVTTSEDSLRQHFSRYGDIRSLRLVRDVVTGLSRGYAFVEYEREEDFVMAYRESHRAVIDGARILVEFERERVVPGWKPRRLGGGFGGKKESGQLRFGGRDRPFRNPYQRPTVTARRRDSSAPPGGDRRYTEGKWGGESRRGNPITKGE